MNIVDVTDGIARRVVERTFLVTLLMNDYLMFLIDYL